MYSSFLVGYVVKTLYSKQAEVNSSVGYFDKIVFSLFVPIYFALVGVQLNVVNDFSLIRFIVFFIIAFGLEFIGRGLCFYLVN